MSTETAARLPERNEPVSLSALLLVAATIISSAMPCIEVPNLELSFFDLPILLTLIWHRWPFAIANLVLGAATGLVLWGIHDVMAWAVIYLNTLLLIGFIILVKRGFRQLGLSVVGIAYWLLVGTPVTFILFSLQFTDNSVAIIATGQRLFSGVLVITAAIAFHFAVVLIQHRLPDALFGGERRFTVRMREIAESAAVMAASIPMLFLIWALIDRDIDSEIDALFAASDARFESLAQAASNNLTEQRDVLRELLSLSGGASLEQRMSLDGFDEQLLAVLNADGAIGFALRTDAQAPMYLSEEARAAGLSVDDIVDTSAGAEQATAIALTDNEQGLTGYVLSTTSPSLILIYESPLTLWDALYGADMLGLMSGLEDTGMIDRVSHFHGPSGQELYGISDDATIVREEYDYAIWIPPARQVEKEKAFKRVERLSKSYITFQASDQLIESFDRDLYDVDCFRYTIDLWSHVRGSLVNQSFLIFGATLVLLLMAGLIEFAVARFSQPFMQLAQAMQRFSQAPPNEQRPSFEFDLTTGTNLFRHLAKGFNQMEAAVRESTQRVASLNTSYESLLNRASIGFIATDTVGNIEYINPTADDLMRAVTDLPARIQAETENDADVASINVSNQDQVLNLLATQTSRVNLNGVIDGKWLIVYDVSALRSTERKLLEAQRLSTLGQLTTGMSHEISQPLQAMTLTVANLKRSLRDHIEEKPTLGEKLQRIDGNLHKIANLIKFMQTYGGAGSLTDESFDPGESINEALTGYQDSSANRLTITFKNDLPPTARVTGDPEQFALVIHHIVKNSGDAADEKLVDAPQPLNITAELINDRIMICLTDTCGGIPESVLPYIFDPFYTTKEPDKGMGLGLSVSLGIITSMGGHISASNISGGAQFKLDVPLAD